MNSKWLEKSPKIFLFVIPASIGILIFAAFLLFAQGPQRRAVKEQSKKVRVIQTPSLSVVHQAIGYGTVEPSKIWKAIAEVSGDIVAMHPKLNEGEFILESTRVLQIDPSQYELEVQQAHAQLNQHQANLKELETNLQNYRALLDIQKEIL